MRNPAGDLGDDVVRAVDAVSGAAEIAADESPGHADGVALSLAAADGPDRSRMLESLAASPAGIRTLIRVRRARLAHAGPALPGLDDRLRAVLAASFAPERLAFAPIGPFASPALQAHIVRNEAVHPMSGWADLRRRIDPEDRRCFGLFHTALPERPVAFVEAALTERGDVSIDEILDPSHPPLPRTAATAAVLYSISSTEPGLQGIPFGHTLIRRTLVALSQELPWLTAFRTLSPVPGFRTWLADAGGAPSDGDRLSRLHRALEGGDPPSAHAPQLGEAVLAYLRTRRPADGRPIDAVARFHLGNGARIGGVQVGADLSSRGLARSYGVMASYEYERRDA